MAEGSRLDLSPHQVGRITVLLNNDLFCLLNYSIAQRSRDDRMVLVARAEWSHPFPYRTR